MRIVKIILCGILAACLAGCGEDGGKPDALPDNPGNPGNPDNPGKPDNPDNPSDIGTDEGCGEDYAESCDGNTALFCGDSGKVVRRVCGDGMVCKKIAGYNTVDCVSECDKGGYEDRMICDGTSLMALRCLEAEGGGFYEYRFSDPCPKYCYEGVCVEEIPADDGTFCKPETFQPSCDGGAGVSCVENRVVKTPCGGGLECAVSYGAKSYECVESCSNVEPDELSCVEEGGKFYASNTVCRLGTDGKYHRFSEKTACVSSCRDGVCDVAEFPEAGADCEAGKFKGFCHGNTAYRCGVLDGRVEVLTCGLDMYKGQPLCKTLSDGFADCVMPCGGEEENFLQCVTETIRDGQGNAQKVKIADNRICKSALDGGLYLFSEKKVCPNCKNGLCK